MNAWRTLLAGLTVWLVHFGIVYALPSLGAIGAVTPAILTIAHGVTSLACLAAAGLLVLVGWRQSRATQAPDTAFRYRVSALGAALAGVAIVWQSAPALIG